MQAVSPSDILQDSSCWPPGRSPSLNKSFKYIHKQFSLQEKSMSALKRSAASQPPTPRATKEAEETL